MLVFKNDRIYLNCLEPPRPDGTTPARIRKIDPEGIVEVPERSVGFEFECIAEGNPFPRVTWTRGRYNINRGSKIQDYNIFIQLKPYQYNFFLFSLANGQPLPRDVVDMGDGVLLFPNINQVI